ncbi:MAG: 23S rRNA (pseudouridine(1915)-N(3))-methyltransferase RlmH [Epsilonproteobacteria bacterium]|nr:23S rRNA (pseudouridine(1915)-N(3))-methyltransferase RlmH [Campylobacterota bacterium]NPA64524.1 23S rRNA (pseudouridine(1915)-N(3))-methyltransferase RlmH [Campylobacterota bacterium]
MHKIFVYSIGKKDERCYEAIYDAFVKNAKKYATIKQTNIYNKKINTAQSDPRRAQEIYTQILSPYLLEDGLNVALHPAGKLYDSQRFASMLGRRSQVAFFIGGAYGFEEEFLRRCDEVVSLSPLTMSHKVAKVVLLEQIFRGLSILHNHPYHK